MSVRGSEPPGIKMSFSASEVPMDKHSTDPDHQLPRPSAPLLPSGPENPAAVQDMAPPPYSSVIAEDNRSFLHVVDQQPRSMLPLLPESGERPKEPDDTEDVIITAQPVHANMGIADTEDMAKTDPSRADEDPKNRQKNNPDLNTRNRADRTILYDSSCCCICWNPTPTQFDFSNAHSGESNNHGCCSAGDGGNDDDHNCCDDGGDGCCDGGDGGGCCDGGGNDGCCDGGGVDSCDCDCTDCFS